jgi:glycosyltransferase involved in cell wall biosynthesis
MAFCKPVVTTNFPAAYNKINDGKNGFIVEMNPQAVASSIEKLINDENLRNKMVEYQKNHPLSYDEIINSFDTLIDSLEE